MKRPILASILCLTCAITLRAQEKPHPPQLFDPQQVFPSLPTAPNVWGTQAFETLRKLPIQPRRLPFVKGFDAAQAGVCSVPLLEAHANASDPGIAFKPSDVAVPIPQARVPAPSCKK